MKDIILFGVGGHSKIVTDMAEENGYNVVAYIAMSGDSKVHLGKPVYKNVEDIKNYSKYNYFIAIGSNQMRKNIVTKYPNLQYVNIIHKSAIISKYADIGFGNLIMTNVVINAFATIGNQCIINTCAVVEHDCTIANYCHISVKTALAGTVTVGEGVFFGVGSTAKNNVCVGEWVTIGAGAVVVKNLQGNKIYVGCPAKELIKN